MIPDTRISLLEHTLDQVVGVLGEAQVTDVVLDSIADLAAGMIGGAEDAGLALVEGRSITTVADTSHLAHIVDALQMETGEGPSLDASQGGPPLILEDLTADGTWTYFSPRAAAGGARSMLVFPVARGRDQVAVLSFYAHGPNAFSSDDIEIGNVLAGLSCVVLTSMEVNARAELETQQLREALESRDVIGQAKGILMSTHNCTGDDAFEMLRVASQNLNKKLRHVAAELVADTERKIEARRP